ncbi:hypothetical protein RB195_019565 [Necator americanus]|uniref:SET domain-containing protein n=1 Tax=Necator americanus TaxID=51031 RepID=A0ABR1CFU1_NECAM
METRSMSESRQTRRERKTEQDAEHKRIGDLAKMLIPRWIASKRIQGLTVELTEDVYYPKPEWDSYHYCVMCGAHGRFRLAQHILRKHPDLSHRSDEFKVVEQVSRGITERMKKASIDMHKVLAPATSREYRIYREIFEQLRECGIPVKGSYEEPDVVTPVQTQDQMLKVMTDLRDQIVRQIGADFTNEPGPSGVESQAALPSVIVKEQPGPTCPPTWSAPLIPRCRQYRVPDDPDYIGGAKVDKQFTSPPCKELMFAHQWDDFKDGYTEQRFNVPNSLQTSQDHPLFQRYREYLESIMIIPVDGGSSMEIENKGRATYVSYLCRFMLVAMRSRRRLGRIVTMDDAIFSSGMLLSFFETIQKAKVPVTTRKGFIKALSTWYHFLLLVLNTGMGQQRLAEVEQARYRVKDILDRMKGEEKIQVSFRGVLPRRQRKAETLYCVVRMIVAHNRVLNAMREIYSEFADTHNLERREYNYFMGALMAYIVHCNTARNECIYKMMYGSIYPPSDREPSETGLQKKSITRRDGVMEDYWVGVYGKGKTAERIREESTYRGNFFVIDEVSRLLVEMYTRMREWVAERNEIRLANIKQPDSPFFLSWFGRAVSPSMVPRLMRRFFTNSGCDSLNISCNTSRHQTARLQYERYLEKSYRNQQMPGVDTECAILAGHKPLTQLLNYNDSYISACAIAYSRLKKYADREARKNADIIERVRSMVKIVNLKEELTREQEEAEIGEDLETPESVAAATAAAATDDGETTSLSSAEGSDYEATAVSAREHTRSTSPQLLRRSARQQKRMRKDPYTFEVETEGVGEAGALERSSSSSTASSSPLVRRRKYPPVKGESSRSAQLSAGGDYRIDEEPVSMLVDPDELAFKSVEPSAVELGEDAARRDQLRKTCRRTDTEFVAEKPVKRIVIDDEDDEEDDDDEKEEYETGTHSQVTDDRRTFASPSSLLPSPPEVGPVKSDDGGDGSGSNGGDDSGDSSNSTSDRLVIVDEPAKGTAPPTSSTPQSLAITAAAANSQLTESTQRQEVVDVVTVRLQQLNATEYTGGLTSFSTDFERRDFLRRRQQVPIQDFPWVEIREIPSIGGRGVFAKVPIPKDSVVCDYRGLVKNLKEVDEMLTTLTTERRKYVEAYLVQYTVRESGKMYQHAILAHEPTYKGTVTIGRLLNHSSKHPNLANHVYTTFIEGRLDSMVYFRAIREIKVSEQLLWDYGKQYNKEFLRKKCICNVCDPQLVEESTACLKPLTTTEVATAKLEAKAEPWSGDPSLSQQVFGSALRRAPFGVRDLLLSAARTTRVRTRSQPLLLPADFECNRIRNCTRC